jgi:hypothetical protein
MNDGNDGGFGFLLFIAGILLLAGTVGPVAAGVVMWGVVILAVIARLAGE